MLIVDVLLKYLFIFVMIPIAHVQTLCDTVVENLILYSHIIDRMNSTNLQLYKNFFM